MHRINRINTHRDGAYDKIGQSQVHKIVIKRRLKFLFKVYRSHHEKIPRNSKEHNDEASKKDSNF